jgi:pyruvate dehydrogenase E2 component (dihydrolipoamide acetyltransferase)
MAERVFALPDLGEGLEEAVVTSWLVAEGDEVDLNQPFVEIETAKAVVEVPAPWAGRVVTLHVKAGQTLAVGAPLVTFEVAGRVAEGPDGGSSSPAASVLEGVSTGDDSPSIGPLGSARTTPAVRKVAKELGVDLTSVSGTGSQGRITREDVEVAAAAASASDFEVVPISLVRRTIARNLEAVARIPQVTTFRTVDCSALEGFRRELGVSPLPVFVAALVATARDHAWINASWADDGVRLQRVVNVGFAADTERGLVVPVMRDAGAMGIAQISAEITRLADAARSNALTHEEVSGATIAVSNTGSYGSESGTPLLNPGHAVTVALGVIAPRALVVEERVEARPACTLSCTFDHRVLDGATVGRASATWSRSGSNEQAREAPTLSRSISSPP